MDSNDEMLLREHGLTPLHIKAARIFDKHGRDVFTISEYQLIVAEAFDRSFQNGTLKDFRAFLKKHLGINDPQFRTTGTRSAKGQLDRVGDQLIGLATLARESFDSGNAIADSCSAAAARLKRSWLLPDEVRVLKQDLDLQSQALRCWKSLIVPVFRSKWERSVIEFDESAIEDIILALSEFDSYTERRRLLLSTWHPCYEAAISARRISASAQIKECKSQKRDDSARSDSVRILDQTCENNDREADDLRLFQERQAANREAARIEEERARLADEERAAEESRRRNDWRAQAERWQAEQVALKAQRDAEEKALAEELAKLEAEEQAKREAEARELAQREAEQEQSRREAERLEAEREQAERKRVARIEAEALEEREREKQHEEKRDRLRAALDFYDEETISKLTGKEYEFYLDKLIRRIGGDGIRVLHQGGTNDKGADLIIVRWDGHRLAVVQAKRQKASVGTHAVEQAHSARGFYGCDEAWVITNSRFGWSATELAERHNVELINGDPAPFLRQFFARVANTVSDKSKR